MFVCDGTNKVAGIISGVKKCHTPVQQGVPEASGSVTVQMTEGSAHAENRLS